MFILAVLFARVPFVGFSHVAGSWVIVVVGGSTDCILLLVIVVCCALSFVSKPFRIEFAVLRKRVELTKRRDL